MIAFLGLGRMGAPMARRLVAAGHDVTVWNRTPGRAEIAGAAVRETLADAVRGASVVVSMLSDPAAVVDVFSGAAPALRPDALVIEMSTIGPSAISELRAALPASVSLVDAPVLGSVEPATSGTLTVLAGGEDADLARAEPILSVFGTVTRTGGPGTAAEVKLAVMSVLIPLRVSLGEALAGRATTADQETLLDLLDSVLARPARRQLGDPDGPTRYSLAHAAKDLALAAGGPGGERLTIAAAALARLRAAERDGLGERNHTTVVHHIAKENQ